MIPGTGPRTGVAPVTRRSGTHISHEFRWNVNRQLRDAICDFADGSRHARARRTIVP